MKKYSAFTTIKNQDMSFMAEDDCVLPIRDENLHDDAFCVMMLSEEVILMCCHVEAYLIVLQVISKCQFREEPIPGISAMCVYMRLQKCTSHFRSIPGDPQLFQHHSFCQSQTGARLQTDHLPAQAIWTSILSTNLNRM